MAGRSGSAVKPRGRPPLGDAAITPKKRNVPVRRERAVPAMDLERQRLAELRDLEAKVSMFERAQIIQRARVDLLAYTMFTMPDPEAPDDVNRSAYQPAAFHRAVARALEDVERGETRQLIFCMPPRHGKTEIATKRNTAWLSGKHPEWNIAVGTYSDTMAQDFGADTRAILTSQQHRQVFPTYKLRKGGTAKDNIQTEQGGRLVFVGRGGALTGRGAHALLIDDIFKDHEEARSKTIRDQAWNWFTKVAMTRRMGPKLVIITMTRWHSDDIVGRLTDPESPYYDENEARRWKIIRLPAIAEEDDPLGRKAGEALWPKDAGGEPKYDLDFLLSQQRLDPLGFAALYQQRPTVADGVLFRRETIQFYRPDELPSNLRIYAASDHAVGTTQRHDSTVMLVVGVDHFGNIYLLDCWWARQPTDIAVEALLTLAASHKPLLWWAERGHISKSIGPFLRKRMQETGTYVNIREVTPVGDKEQRAQSIAARVGMGKVYFPRNAVWTEKAINELLAFPNGTHDDFVDALAYIGLGLGSQFSASAPAPKSKQVPAFGTLAWVKWTEKWRNDRSAAKSAGGF